jgi:hypothetical protein
LSTKPGLREKAAAVGEAGAAVAASAVAEAEDEEAVVVAVAAEAEAGTAAIAAVGEAATAAGKRLQHLRVAKRPGSFEAPRFCFARHPS